MPTKNNISARFCDHLVTCSKETPNPWRQARILLPDPVAAKLGDCAASCHRYFGIRTWLACELANIPAHGPMVS